MNSKKTPRRRQQGSTTKQSGMKTVSIHPHPLKYIFNDGYEFECDYCKSDAKDQRNHCIECDDFDLCMDCFDSAVISAVSKTPTGKISSMQNTKSNVKKITRKRKRSSSITEENPNPNLKKITKKRKRSSSIRKEESSPKRKKHKKQSPKQKQKAPIQKTPRSGLSSSKIQKTPRTGLSSSKSRSRSSAKKNNRHKHPLYFMHDENYVYFCDVCDKEFNKQRYYCKDENCDYDVCMECYTFSTIPNPNSENPEVSTNDKTEKNTSISNRRSRVIKRTQPKEDSRFNKKKRVRESFESTSRIAMNLDAEGCLTTDETIENKTNQVQNKVQNRPVIKSSDDHSLKNISNTIAIHPNEIEKNRKVQNVQNIQKSSVASSETLMSTVKKSIVKPGFNLSAFHTSSGQSGIKLIGRQKELSLIRNFLGGCIGSGVGNSLYICGLPGTGKSMCVSNVVKEIRAWQSSCKARQTKGDKSASNRVIPPEIEKRFNAPKKRISSKQKMTVLIVDEVDYLIQLSNKETLYELFEWPKTRYSSLVVIGIANAVDLTERFLPRLRRLNREPQIIVFSPYNTNQLTAILQERLSMLTTDNSNAIELCARRVASSTGDVCFFFSNSNFFLVRNFVPTQLESKFFF
eukprot:GSMAST32.ASY1.ANO1.2411.1 assembled CDS